MAIELMVTEILGMLSQSDINEMAQLFSDFVDGCISVPINMPGFHYHTAMKVTIQSNGYAYYEFTGLSMYDYVYLSGKGENN